MSTKSIKKQTQGMVIATGAGIPAHAAGMVTDQYNKALLSYSTALIEGLRLGGMLRQIETTLTRDVQDGCIQRGDSLKGWLAEHCPTVDYQKAIKYKTLSEGLQEFCKIPAKVPLDVILPGSDCDAEEQTGIAQARIDKMRRDVADFLDGKSARQLEIAFGCRESPAKLGGSRDGSGRPSTADVSAETRAGAAWALLGKQIDHATSWHFTRFLPESIAIEALETATMLRDALKARVDEAKRGR